MLPSFSLRAPAKINLSLEVLGRRADGYHEVRTVLQAVDLTDRLTFEAADDLNLWVEPSGMMSSLAPIEANLVLRAARLLRNEAGVAAGARVTLDKNIPIAAGLGGGSSNAATTLLGLRRLWGVDISEERLLQLAAKLGADVPFFIRGGTALGTGRGDRLRPLPTKQGQWAAVLSSEDATPENKTARLYGLLTAEHHIPEASHSGCLISRLESGESLTDALYNAFGAVAPHAHPGYETMAEAFCTAGADGAILAGSGPSLFALASSEVTANQWRERLQAQGLRAYAVRFLSAWSLDGLP